MHNVFEDYFASGIQVDAQRGGVTLTIPKRVEAEILELYSAWWWRTPRKAPDVPVHLITARHSPFLFARFTARHAKTYGIEFSVVEGGHMFPLENPETTATHVQQLIQKTTRLTAKSSN